MAQNDRIHALDAVRGFALLAGVALHATMSFWPGFGKLGWPIIDCSPSTTLSLLFFVVHMFRMTLFFVIAGLFGRMLLHRYGVRSFIFNRSIRVFVPLLVGRMILYPAVVATIIFGAVRSGITAAPQLPTGLVSIPALLPFPLAHLWFLNVLLLLYGVALIIHLCLNKFIDRKGNIRFFADATLRGIVSGPWASLVLAIPLSISLYLAPYWSPGGGVPAPAQSLIPNPPAAIAFGLAFFVGWLLHRQLDLMKCVEKQWFIHFLIALIATVACLSQIGLDPNFRQVIRGWKDFAIAVCYSIGIWSWTLAILGGGMRYFSQANATRRYIADASYWIYLTHLPLVFFLQAMFMKLNLHWSIKFPSILAITLVILFLSYHYLVRNTFIGFILNGRRYPRTAVRNIDPKKTDPSFHLNDRQILEASSADPKASLADQGSSSAVRTC